MDKRDVANDSLERRKEEFPGAMKNIMKKEATIVDNKMPRKDNERNEPLETPSSEFEDKTESSTDGQQRRCNDGKRLEIVANIGNTLHPVSIYSRYNGIVIATGMRYTHSTHHHSVESFNYLYSPHLGIIKSMNYINKEHMKLGEVYHFRVTDDRLRSDNSALHSLQSVRAVDWQLCPQYDIENRSNGTFEVLFHFHSNEIRAKQGNVLGNHFVFHALMNRVYIHDILEDRLLSTNWKVPIEKVPHRTRTHVKAVVRLVSNFQDEFITDSNAPIFKIVRLDEVTDCDTGDLLPVQLTKYFVRPVELFI